MKCISFKHQGIFARTTASLTMVGLSIAIYGCSSNGTADTPTAEQIRISDSQAVPAANVQAALSTLWPLLGRVESVEASATNNTASVAALQEQIGQLNQGHTASVGPGGAEVPIPDALVQLVAKNQQLEATVNQLSQEKEKLQGELAELKNELKNSLANISAQVNSIQSNLAQHSNRLDDLQTTQGQPRDCPEDMVVLNDASCIEKDVRQVATFSTATGICTHFGRRVCSWHEMYAACSNSFGPALEPIFGETGVREVPHWAGDSASRLYDGFTERWIIAGLAFGGRNSSGFPNCAEYILEAGPGVLGPDTPTSAFHYRCCIDRL